MQPVSHLLRNMPTSRSLGREEFVSQVEAISRNAAAALDRDRQVSRMRVVEGVVRRSAIPTRYRDAKLSACVPGQRAAYASVMDYASRFDEMKKTGAGILLYGDIGTGKTYAACALGNALIQELRPVMYCTVLEAVMLIKRSWQRGSDVSEFEAYDQFTVPDLLILDEVGVQHGSEFEAMVLSSIIDARSRACLPTLAISNHDVQAVAEIIGERAFDRLLGFGGQVIEMRGPSLRHRVVGGNG